MFLIILCFFSFLFFFYTAEPSAPSPSEPTVEPFDPTPTTPSPTSANSIPIRGLPFALTYSPSASTVPSTTDYAQLAEVTRLYMEQFMVAEFSQTSLTNLDDFVTFMTRNEFQDGEPVIAQYRSTGLFNPSSIFLPTVRELNQLISEAYNRDNMPEYLSRVRSLPSSNPLSRTESIAFEQLDEDAAVGSGDSTSSIVRAAVAAGAAGVVVLAAGLAIMRSRSSGGVAELDEDATISPHKEVSGDATVADETCNMSTDGSSYAAQSWKTPVGFRNTTEEDDEFHDEPLDSDSDDEDTLSTTNTRTVSQMS